MSFKWVSCFMCEECGLERPSPEVPCGQLGYAIYLGRGAETRPAAAVTTDASTPVDGQTLRASRPPAGVNWTGVRRDDRVVKWERSDGHATTRLRRGSNTWHVRADRLYQSVRGHGYEDEQFESEAETRKTANA